MRWELWAKCEIVCGATLERAIIELWTSISLQRASGWTTEPFAWNE